MGEALRFGGGAGEGASHFAFLHFKMPCVAVLTTNNNPLFEMWNDAFFGNSDLNRKTGSAKKR